MQLKHYQQESLHRLQTYLETAAVHGDGGNVRAYNAVQQARFEGAHFRPFQPLKGLEQVPYVCLRLPTGGGKTLLCAHSIQLAGKAYLAHDFPLVLWLVPTTTIKKQTLETLQKPLHPNHQVLQAAFGDHFRMFDIADFAHVRPLVLVDEAHNAKSDLSMEVLRRVNPSAVIEYTATPAKNSNVIQSVTAAQLKAEHMIKLPIVFAQHLDWKAAVTSSIQTRAGLEQAANKDADYIRPLVLFQAENKGGTVTVDALRDFLIQQENIPAEQIAIATGGQRELDDLNLFAPNCPIRYVITVQALKEGWDCSFAYVLCSVANTRSSVAVEQLLGRVLRMPYATLRSQPELN